MSELVKGAIAEAEAFGKQADVSSGDVPAKVQLAQQAQASLQVRASPPPPPPPPLPLNMTACLLYSSCPLRPMCTRHIYPVILQLHWNTALQLPERMSPC